MNKLMMSAEAHGIKTTIELSDEASAEEAVDAFEKLLLAIGYQQENIDQLKGDN